MIRLNYSAARNFGYVNRNYINLQAVTEKKVRGLSTNNVIRQELEREEAEEWANDVTT